MPAADFKDPRRFTPRPGAQAHARRLPPDSKAALLCPGAQGPCPPPKHKDFPRARAPGPGRSAALSAKDIAAGSAPGARTVLGLGPKDSGIAERVRRRRTALDLSPGNRDVTDQGFRLREVPGPATKDRGAASQGATATKDHGAAHQGSTTERARTADRERHAVARARPHGGRPSTTDQAVRPRAVPGPTRATRLA